MIEESKKTTHKINLTNDDKTWIQNEYPSLKITSSKIAGELCFQRTYNNITMLDCFNIEISLYHSDFSILPKVKCLDDKIKNIADSLNLKMDQLHTNNDESFCLTVYPKEKSFFINEVFTIKEFFVNLLEPYLYWISYYSKYKKAPWGEYSHGALGILEYISEETLTFRQMYRILKNNNISLRKMVTFYRQRKCFCDESKDKTKSEGKIRNCHNQAWNGIKNIRKLFCNRLGKKI